MIKTKKISSLILIATMACASLALPARSQNATSSTPPADTIVPAPAAPPIFTTPSNSFQPFTALANLLPGWDPTLTNTFGPNELIIGATPLWKAQQAAGSTPYLSTFADYFFTKNIGAEGELVTLGDGAGNSSVDSAALLLKPRKDIGNLAGYLLAGPSIDLHQGRWGGDVGLGVVYRYHTSVEVFGDTRYRVEGRQADRNGWLARVGVTFAFSKYH